MNENKYIPVPINHTSELLFNDVFNESLLKSESLTLIFSSHFPGVVPQVAMSCASKKIQIMYTPKAVIVSLSCFVGNSSN